MAISTVNWAKISELVGSKAEVHGFDGLANGEWTESLSAAHLSDKTMQTYGTFGAGGSITFYGTNNLDDVGLDPSSVSNSWIPLKDNQDTDIVKTASGGDIIIENYWYICAMVTAGDGTTDLNLRICAKG